ncbi:MAG: hypothetical protein VW405_17105, partial [Rhodospirillaceae bacterium]
AKYYADPLGYVMFNFPWSTDTEIQVVELQGKWAKRFPACKYGPDVWACESLDRLGKEVRDRGFDGKHAVSPIQFAISSGHGIGKSAMTAWLTMWIMDTRPFCKGTVTANTAEQLISKTWAELGKWHSRALTSKFYDYNATRGNMVLQRVGFKDKGSWVVRGQTCREENSEAFAGQHAVNSTSFYIFDEASAVPDEIYRVREGGLTDGEPMTFDFGNPTRNTGRFYEECEGQLARRYIRRKIDSRSAQITNKDQINRWIEDFGIDSDFVRVRVLGEFPKAGALQFISTEDVIAASERELPAAGPAAPLMIGVDVARFGDDESVIYPRLGMDARTFEPRRFRGLDTVQLTGQIIKTVKYFEGLGKRCSGLFVDAGGVGGGVVDQLRSLGYSPISVQFGSRPTDVGTYRYKGDEMWGRLREALHHRLAIPSLMTEAGRDLKDQLTQREYGYTVAGNKINLESKADMKSRLGHSVGSPDLADALACSFATEIAQTTTEYGAARPAFDRAITEYDPYSSNW